MIGELPLLIPTLFASICLSRILDIVEDAFGLGMNVINASD